jgi:hypothetical protein
LEAALSEPDVVVVSQETPDGGKPGFLTEVPRRMAAKLMVEGKARLAGPDEAKQYHAEAEQRAEAARDRAAASRIRIAVIPEADLKSKKPAGRDSKPAA